MSPLPHTRPPHTRRAGQKWVHDYLVMKAGRPTLFDHEERRYPASVKSYAMVPKHLARLARRKEQWAAEAEAHGHVETAHELYWAAVDDWHQAQHAIHRDTPQKRLYYERLSACYDKVIQHNPTPIERVEVPWEGSSIPCLYHPLPGKPKAPAVLFVPGMDMVKEVYPPPADNPFHRRGMHVLVMDGPGVGASRLRGLLARPDNYERAASAVLDHLLARPEVEAEQLGVLGVSMGSYWGTRVAAFDARVRAVATISACYGSKQPIFELASPRFKWQFMFMAGLEDEAAFDRMAEQMTCLGLGSRIRCPALMVVSEYDQLSYLDDSLALFEELGGPREFWLLEDESHAMARLAAFAGNDARHSMLDWLRDVLRRGLPPDHARFVRLARGGRGPYEGPSGYPPGLEFAF